MEISLAERLLRKSSRVAQHSRSLLKGCIEIQFLGETVKFVQGSTITAGGFSLPRVSHRNRIVRDSDFIQQLALSAYLESTPECKLFVDVGAYHGYYAVSVGKHLAKTGGKVIAVEPDPANFEKLHASVALNDLADTVTCIDAACSDQCGEMYFNPGDAEGMLSNEAKPGSKRVEVKTLDAILDELQIDTPIGCLMIDVEGAELPVLRGLSPQRRRNAKMFVEMHPYTWNEFGYTPAEFDEYLRQQGLCCIDMFHRIHTAFAADPWAPNYIGPTTLVERASLFRSE